MGNFCRRKRSQSGGKKDCPEKTFVDCLLVPPKDDKSPNLEEKSFANSHKTSKFFFLESFPLYGSLIQILATGSCTTERKQNKTKQNKQNRQTNKQIHLIVYFVTTHSLVPGAPIHSFTMEMFMSAIPLAMQALL